MLASLIRTQSIHVYVLEIEQRFYGGDCVDNLDHG